MIIKLMKPTNTGVWNVCKSYICNRKKPSVFYMPKIYKILENASYFLTPKKLKIFLRIFEQMNMIR